LNEELYELPVHWAWVKLGEVGTIVGGGTPRRDNPDFYKNGTIPWATPTDIDQKEILTIFRTAEKITEEAVKGSSAKVLPAGTVLFSSRASIGKIAIAGTELATNQGFANIIPSSILDSKYLAYGLRYFTKNIERLGSGTTYVEVAKSSLKDFYFPLAPLGEQKRIVAKAEALLAESKTAREALDKVPDLLRRFRQSVLAKAFRGELTQRDPNDEPALKLLEKIKQRTQTKLMESEDEKPSGLSELPEEWIWIRLGNLIESMKNGLYKPLRFYGPGIPCLRMYNIEDGKIVWRNVKEMILSDKETDEYSLQENDILLNRVNSRELVGKAAVIPRGIGKVVFESKNIRIRVRQEFVDPRYVSYFLLTHYARDQIELECKQTVGMATVSQEDIKSWFIPYTSLNEQKRVVVRIEEAFSLSDQVEAAAKRARERAEKIDQAILTKAFKGELVPQDPDDEPASILLQRLKTK